MHPPSPSDRTSAWTSNEGRSAVRPSMWFRIPASTAEIVIGALREFAEQNRLSVDLLCQRMPDSGVLDGLERTRVVCHGLIDRMEHLPDDSLLYLVAAEVLVLLGALRCHGAGQDIASIIETIEAALNPPEVVDLPEPVAAAPFGLMHSQRAS